VSDKSDDNQASKNYNKRLRQEYAELDNPVVKAQMQLDRWWQAKREFEEEFDDCYEVGGFLEYHSQTPSFHKSRRDRDWRVR
jgi:hypothetical protein